MENNKFLITKYFFIVLLSINYLGYSQNNLPPQSFERYTGKKYLNLLIDIRNQDLYEKGRIKNAIHMDIENPGFENRIKLRFVEFDSIFVYCQNGKKSQDALVTLKDMGYKNIFYLEGGFENWIRSSKPYKSSLKTKAPLAYYSEKDLEQYVKNYKYVLVDFYADWCGPCKKMAPIFQKIAEENPEVKLLKINADFNQTLVKAKEVEEIPTLLIYKYGQQKWRKTGLISKKQLEDLLR